MSTYHHGTNIYAQHRRWRTVHAICLVLLLALVGAGAAFGWREWRKLGKEQVTNQATTPVYDTYNPKPVQVYDNPTFRFSSDEPWTLSKTDSTPPTKYTYVSTRNGLVERQITTYIGPVPQGLAVTYILPVISRGDSIAPGEVSPRCGEGLKLTNLNPLTRTYQNVTYTCIPDSKAVIIAAGVAKGGYGVTLKGSDGENRTLTFIYKDMSLSPRPAMFGEVLRTLRLK